MCIFNEMPALRLEPLSVRLDFTVCVCVCVRALQCCAVDNVRDTFSLLDPARIGGEYECSLSHSSEYQRTSVKSLDTYDTHYVTFCSNYLAFSVYFFSRSLLLLLVSLTVQISSTVISKVFSAFFIHHMRTFIACLLIRISSACQNPLEISFVPSLFFSFSAVYLLSSVGSINWPGTIVSMI